MSIILPFMKNRQNHTDSELINRFRHIDDTAAFEELCHRYCHLVFGVCQKYLQNEDDSKDAVLEIFTKLTTDLKNHEIKNFRGWLYSVTKNFCLMKQRQKKKMSFVSENFDNIREDFVEFDDADTLINEQKEDKLYHALGQLNDSQQRCIRLFYLEEKSYREIVEITGFDLKQVKSYIQNGKRNLRNLMNG